MFVIIFLFHLFCSVIASDNIYGDQAPISLTETEQQGIVATLIVLLFVLMAFEVAAPEVLFLIALMICCLTQIITLSETLSGTIHFLKNDSLLLLSFIELVSCQDFRTSQ